MSQDAGRSVWAGWQLLDRQIVAHDDKLAGCVDDLELTVSDDGNELYVTAVLSGPGALAYRLGHRRLGDWLRRAHWKSGRPEAPDDPVRIPFNVVADIGSHVQVALDAEATGTASLELWTRDHVVAHIPGSRHEPE
jgi:hypothetical protein